MSTQQQWYRRRADKVSAAAARRSTKVGGGGAHKLSAAARPAHGFRAHLGHRLSALLHTRVSAIMAIALCSLLKAPQTKLPRYVAALIIRLSVCLHDDAYKRKSDTLTMQDIA